MLRRTRPLLISICAIHFGLLSGCATLVGNVKPVEEKSASYGVADLSKDPDWTQLDGEKADIASTEVSDVAFQSRRTAAIISLNSSCRRGREHREDLHSITNLLLLGMTDVAFRTERELQVAQTLALETTVQGKLNGEEMRIRAVVLRREGCIYDLLYVARPEYFAQNERDFSQFVDSLRLKE